MSKILVKTLRFYSLRMSSFWCLPVSIHLHDKFLHNIVAGYELSLILLVYGQACIVIMEYTQSRGLKNI